jgi:hypothetical protein
MSVWLKTVVLTAIILAECCSFNLAEAVEVKSPVSFHAVAGKSAATRGALVSPAAMPREQTPGTWLVSFPSEAAIVAINVSVQGTPTGYTGSAYDVELPFDWADRNGVLPSAAVNDTTVDGSVGRFLNDVGSASALDSFQSLILNNQRARVIFQGRYDSLSEGRSPSLLDIRVAYWFAVTARELALRYYVVPDEFVMSAMAWLSNLAAASPKKFTTATAEVGQVKQVAVDLKSRLNVLYSRVVVSADSAVARQDLNRGCPQLKDVYARLKALDQDSYAAATAGAAVELRAYTTLALCLTKELKAKKEKGAVSQPDVTFAQELSDRLGELSAKASGAEQMNATSRRAELAQMIELVRAP